MSKNVWPIVGLTLLFLVLLAVPAASTESHSAPSGSFNVLSIREDRFYNWDFRTHPPETSSNVDMPVTMLFWNGATVDIVKQRFALGLCGSTKHLLIDDGGGWQDSHNGGIKDNCGGITRCAEGTSRHLRIYAANGDYFTYNGAWLYYVLGTTHKDNYHKHSDGSCHWHWSGYPEEAEDWFGAYYANRWGSSKVAYDWGNFYNYTSFTASDGHIGMYNNGYATAVKVD